MANETACTKTGKAGTQAEKHGTVINTNTFYQEPNGPSWLKAPENSRQGVTVSMASILTMFLFLGCQAGLELPPLCDLAP